MVDTFEDLGQPLGNTMGSTLGEVRMTCAQIRSRIAAAAALAAAAAAFAAPALAGDVRPPDNADVGGGATGGSISLPGSADVEAPDIRTTMEEKRKVSDDEAVSADKVQELRNMAIDEFGQSSGSQDDASNE